LASLGCSPEQPWLTAALAGSAQKLQQAVTSPGGEQALVDMLQALSQLPVQAPDDLLTVAVDQLQMAIDRLNARQISAAMAAMKKLRLDPDEKLMASYLNRAAAAALAGQASVCDMAGVLQSLAEADVLPGPPWLQQYIAAVRPRLTEADSNSLAAIAHATAVLSIAGQGQSAEQLHAVGAANPSNPSYTPNPEFVSDLLTVSLTRLGSNYMDAQRILNSPDYKPPFSLPALAECCWGVLQLGAQPQQVLPMVNMLVNKSYDRFSQLTVQQLAGVAWSVARCSTISSSKGTAKVKLPSKWLNQFAAAAGPDVAVLSEPQMSDLVWALGTLYLPADDQYLTSSSSTESSSSVTTGGSNATAISNAGSSSAVPVQQLLRAVASHIDAQILLEQEQQQPSATFMQQAAASDVSTLINLLTRFDCLASSRLLKRFCSDVASNWPQLNDTAVADVAVAVAVLVPAGSCGNVIPEGWLQQLAGQVQLRCGDIQEVLPSSVCELHGPLKIDVSMPYTTAATLCRSVDSVGDAL
jgi:hypothetical protein